MNVYKPSELIALLKAHATAAKKRFSQNFLIDANILNKIVSAAHIQKGDAVLEIGAGPGALTAALLKKGARVTAIEIDLQLIPILKLLEGENTLEIIEGDALSLPLDALCQARAEENTKVKVVANLPYHITTPLLARLLPLHQWVESLTVMVQKEFADRMLAHAGTSDYSSFTLFVQFYSRIQRCFNISPSCFYPAPKVHSTVVNCQLKSFPLTKESVNAFFKMTRTAFQQRRKMLRSTLKALYPLSRLDAALQALHISLNVRPEELSLDQFLLLFRDLER
ncbi:MAG TPA: 16S rRNA (adenine(1518)-N(6)/adenine(1519)-N(6))-dimethyltransferase RsmA [Rhabdochlamydiaceae bacterium]|jgi:16S rRNA (adenine1518-N6/adenine1519-N6)-dimethyltransferase